MFNLVRTFYLITQASHKNMVTVICTCAGGHQATDAGVASLLRAGLRVEIQEFLSCVFSPTTY